MATLAGVFGVVLVVYVVGAPFFAARYPLMTDLPFHAANASIMAHYGDPAWHFREQFLLQPVRVPYVTMYGLAAALMSVCSPLTAIKIATMLMLALLPAGLAVMFHGMRKSPLLGLLGLGLVWCSLSQWGFINFLGALGLFAMVVGLTLRQLDSPRRWRSAALFLLLVLLFFTHPFRAPFALCAVIGSALVMYPATRRFRPILVPWMLATMLFGLWMSWRPDELSGDVYSLAINVERFDQVRQFLYRSFRDPDESRTWMRALKVFAVLTAVLAGMFVAQGRLRARSRRQWAWGIGTAVVVAACAGVSLLAYLMLPMEFGSWWYVYPREITAACFVALGLSPDLPRGDWAKLIFVGVLACALIPLAQVVEKHYRRFDEATRDFTAIVERIPPAPKLLYLVFDHQGTQAIRTPYIHLPAYVQAERGGWLSFHFASWGQSPIIYRPRGEPGAVVPPATSRRWEWSPHRFLLERDGAFFDWFLIRHSKRPDLLFHREPAIEMVANHGRWWLYQRRSAR